MHWRWRLRSVERIAELMNPVRFGVKALYVFGSTQNATAGPQSDIDLLIHCTGTEEQKAGKRIQDNNIYLNANIEYRMQIAEY